MKKIKNREKKSRKIAEKPQKTVKNANKMHLKQEFENQKRMPTAMGIGVG